MSHFNRPNTSRCLGGAAVKLAIAALLAFVPGLAQGSITGVSASPTSVNVGETVNISVTGQGFCPELLIQYGDGQQTSHHIVTLGSGSPLNVTHSYTTPGSKTIQAKGLFACTGQASAQVQVKAKRGADPDPSKKNWSIQRDGNTIMKKKPFTLEKKGNQQIKFLRPKITKVLSLPGPHVRPGADLHITGIAFGGAKGSVYIHGTFNNSPRKLSTIKSWTNTKIVAEVPPNWGGAIGGVCGWTIEVEVRSAKNVASHKAGMVWAAQHRELSWKDSAVSVTQCGYDGNIDMCNGNRQLQGCFIQTFSHDGKADPGLTIDGLHFNCAATTEDDKGTDKYAITLPPGWQFDKLTVKNQKTSGPGDSNNYVTGPTPAFPVGKTTWNPSFAWRVTQDDWVAYEYRVRAKAPETCPW